MSNKTLDPITSGLFRRDAVSTATIAENMYHTVGYQKIGERTNFAELQVRHRWSPFSYSDRVNGTGETTESWETMFRLRDELTALPDFDVTSAVLADAKMVAEWVANSQAEIAASAEALKALSKKAREERDRLAEAKQAAILAADPPIGHCDSITALLKRIRNSEIVSPSNIVVRIFKPGEVRPDYFVFSWGRNGGLQVHDAVVKEYQYCTPHEWRLQYDNSYNVTQRRLKEVWSKASQRSRIHYFSTTETRQTQIEEWGIQDNLAVLNASSTKEK